VESKVVVCLVELAVFFMESKGVRDRDAKLTM
jgi:hypothetical protein